MKNDKNNHLWLNMVIIVWNVSAFLYNIERIFTNCLLRLQWLNGTCSWGVCDGPNSHQLARWDCFLPWLAATPQEPMAIACVNRSQQLLQRVYKIPYNLQNYWNNPRVTSLISQCHVDAMIYQFKYHFPCAMYTISRCMYTIPSSDRNMTKYVWNRNKR